MCCSNVKSSYMKQRKDYSERRSKIYYANKKRLDINDV